MDCWKIGLSGKSQVNVRSDLLCVNETANKTSPYQPVSTLIYQSIVFKFLGVESVLSSNLDGIFPLHAV